MILEELLKSLRANAVISIIDDDESVRKSLKRFIKSCGFEAKTFSSALEFLNQGPLYGYGCAIVDVRMPGMSGLDLQKQLLALGSKLPLIFITAHEDDNARKQAMEAGAIDFLQKPFTDPSLMNAISLALAYSIQQISSHEGTRKGEK